MLSIKRRSPRKLQEISDLESSDIVVAESLGKIYDGGETHTVVGLHDVNLSVSAGEFVAIVGPSGSGKSTLLNLIGGLDTHSTGKLLVDGVDLDRLRGDALADFRRETVGFIFQLFNLVPVLSALENVKLPLIPYPSTGVDLDEQARRLLEQVGLGRRLGHLPSQLSGGEQQRVAVARALINDPKILLADEPTGNLDSHAGDELLDLFSQLHHERGMTIIMITHDHNIAARAQRIVELRDGTLVS